MQKLTQHSLTPKYFRWCSLALVLMAVSSAFFFTARGAKLDIPIGGYEGDVSSRTAPGKGSVGISDWVLIGRFVAGDDAPQSTNEFQRADCAPVNTKGDGQLTIADWAQAGRYATGVDPLTAAGGPTAPVPAKAPAQPNAVRDLRIVQTSITDTTVNLSIEYEAAGNENAMGFSITFDQTALGSPQAALGSGATGAQFLFNSLQAANGKLGFAIGLSAGQTLPAGVRQVAMLSFSILKVGLNTSVNFGNSPVGIEFVGVDPSTPLPVPNFTATIIAINNPVPTLTTINPTAAIAGGAAFTLTVNGTNFNNTSIVRWNGADRATTLVNATQLTAAITAADVLSAGTATVTVNNPTPGGGTTSGLTFTINNPLPTLTSLDPTSILAGSAGFTLMLNGTGFNASSVVQVGGVNRATTFVNNTKLSVAVTAAEIVNAGNLNLTVFNPTPGGGTTSQLSLVVNNPFPALTSLNPTSTTTGSAGFTLTVNGTNFVSTSKVRWNGADRTTTFVSATQLTASISADDVKNGGSVNITVFNPTPGGGTAEAISFAINNPAPTVTTLTPNSIASGSSAFTLAVNGTGFVPNSVVRWNGSDRTTTFVSATQVTAALTAADVASAGTAKVRVFNPTPIGGLSSELDFTIIQTNPVPTLASLNPSAVLVGGADFTLTLTGTNFVSASKVRFNGADRATTFGSSTQLTATITAADIASLGTADITVFSPTPGGGTTAALKLVINNPVPSAPTFSVANLTAGTANLTLMLTGSNYRPNSVVKVNGQDRTTTFVSGTQLTVVLLASDVVVGSTLKFTIFTPTPGGGTSPEASLAVNNPTPSIVNLNPPTTFNSLPAFDLTVNGTGFNTASIVRWNGSDRATTFVSNTRLTAKITAADIANVGTAAITVFNPTPGGGTSNAVNFVIEKLTGYEADITPRPTGKNNGTVSIADWVQAGRFFVGLDQPQNASEFQRADSAPKMTKGDGVIGIADWVQAGRYAAGLDAVTFAGGPIVPTSTPPALTATIAGLSSEAQPRIVRAKNSNFRRDQMANLPIELEAQGNENALAFSLNFDPAALQFSDVILGNDTSDAALTINRTQTASGRISLALALPVGQSITAGTRSILNVRFIPAAGSGETSTQVTFTDQLLNRQMADAFANVLPQAEYTNATITLSGTAAANVIAANYIGGELAADSIASAFGANLATTTEGISSAELPTSLGGTSIRIIDSKGIARNAALFFVSPGQVNYQIPADVAEGIASITITNRDGVTTNGLLNITRVAPGLFSADASGTGLAAANVVYVKSDGQQTWESVARYDLTQNRFAANPIDVANDGAYLVLYGTGLKNRSALANVKVRVDGSEMPVEFVGAQGFYSGLDQINIKLAKSLTGHSDANVELIVDGKTANTVRVAIK